MPLSSYLLIPISNNYSNNDFHTYNTSTLPLTSVFLTTLPLTTSSSNNIHPLSAPNPPPHTERKALRESKISAAARVNTDKSQPKPTSSTHHKTNVKVAVGVGATPTSPSASPPPVSGLALASGSSEVDSGSGKLPIVVTTQIANHNHTHIPSSPHTTPTKNNVYEESLRRVRGKLFRRHKSHRSSDDLVSLQ